MAEALVNLRLSADDLAQLMLNTKAVEARFGADRFEVRKKVGPATVNVSIYPEVTGSRLRFIVPFREIRVDMLLGPLARGAVRLVFDWFENRLDAKVAETLAGRGLPWDMAWVDDIQNERGRCAAINVSMSVLNAYLTEHNYTQGLPARIKSMAVTADALVIVLDLAPAVAAQEVGDGS